MNRRAVVLGTAVLSALKLPNYVLPAAGQPNASDTSIVSELPPLPPDLAGKASDPPAPYADTAPVGTARPTNEEIRNANEILVQSPFGVPPVEIANYFLAVGAGAYGNQLRSFAREWPERANPLIYHFFSSTLTKPEGDTTAWCAAFLNWCLLRSHASAQDEVGKSPGSFSMSGKPFSDENISKFSTHSAASGSFRCWNPISPPKRGHIAVFKNAGTDALTAVCRGQGHVAFFLSVPQTGWVRVLGGNQTDPRSGGAITVADMRTGTGSRFMQYVAAR